MLKNNVLEAIDIIAQQKTRTAGYDRTIQASIVKCNDSVIGSYDIKYQGEVLRAYSINKGIEYQKDKKVIVLIPGNNFNNEKIILGEVDKNSLTYLRPTGDQYISNEYNIFDNINDIELCSYRPETQIITYTPKNNYINSLQDSSNICVSFDIQTNIPGEQRDNRGDYGLRFYLNFRQQEDPDKIETKEYIFNTLNMTGSPYYYPNKVSQKTFFEIDGVNFVGIERIEAFVSDFTHVDTTKPADIFISNINLTGAKKLTADQLNGATIAITSYSGFHFGGDIDQIQIQARLLILGKPVSEEEQNVEYYWFKRNVSVSSNSPLYSYYGKSGWACLNEALPITNEKSKFKPGLKTFTFEKGNNAAPSNLYKCVAVKNGEVISKEFTLYNDDAQWRIVVDFPNISNPNIIQKRSGYMNIQFEGNSFPNIICKVLNKQNQEPVYTESNCLWKSFNADGIEKNLQFGNSTDIEYFIENKDYLQTIQDIRVGLQNGTIINKSIINGKEAEVLLEELENYKTVEKPQTNYLNGMYNIHISQIDDFNTFGFAFTDGSGQILAEYEVVVSNENSNSKYHLVLQNGSQSFVYNEDGIRPAAAPLDLTYKLLDANGTEINKNLIVSSWKVPLKDTLLEINTTQGLDQKANLLDTDNKYYLNRVSLPIDIAEDYDARKKNNDIQLVVDYNHYKLSANTNFTFVKQGENGTNGTGAVLTLTAYKGDNPVTVPQFKNGQANFDKIEPRFYKNNQSIIPNCSWSYLNDNSTSTFIKTGENQLLASQISNKNSYKVIKAETTQDGLKYYVTLPIVNSTTTDGVDFYLEDGTGYTEVTYAEDGTRPSYDSNSNFVLKLIDDSYGDISLANNVTMGGVNLNTTYELELPQYFTQQRTQSKNTFKLLPPNNYINDVTSIIPLIFKASYLNKEQTLEIPIHLMLNRYGHAALNDWDGDSIQVQEDGDIILAPQVGAGRKENNAFTGVLIGAVKSSNPEKGVETGLFGYDKGARSIFLDAETGKAEFGKNAKAKIIIDPSREEGVIEGGQFSEEAKTGLQINLTAPSIKFGSGHFSVDSNGNLVAKGGGSIAGWQIGETALTKNNVGMGSDPDGKAFWAGDDFTVDFEGNLHSSSGDIAGWDITDDELSKNNVGMSSNSNKNAFFSGDNFYVTHDGKLFSKDGQIANWTITNNALYSGNKSSFRKKSTPQESVAGIYLGPEGISLGDFTGQGNAFQVNNNGDLKARRGQIANWNISNNAFYTGNTEPYTSGNVPTGKDADKNLTGQLYFGKAGLALGKNFSVNPNGVLYAISGNIGGVTLSNQGLSAGDGSKNWSISGSGQANFTGVTINGAAISSSNMSGGNIGANGQATGLGSLGNTKAFNTQAPMSNGKTLGTYVGDIVADKIDADYIKSKVINTDWEFGRSIMARTIYIGTPGSDGWNIGNELIQLDNRVRELERKVP